MAAGDINLRGVRLNITGTEVQLLQPAGNITVDSVSYPVYAPPVVVDLGSEITVRNYVLQFQVQRTGGASTGAQNYTVLSQTNIRVPPPSENFGVQSTEVKFPGSDPTYPESFMFYTTTAGPLMGNLTGTRIQKWVYFMSYTEPPYTNPSPPPATIATEFKMSDEAHCGIFAFQTPTINVDALYGGHYATMYQAGTYNPDAALVNFLRLLLNGTYGFKWWAVKTVT